MVSPSESAAPDELFVQLQAALAGEYSLERELGRGGMGIVYLASEVRLARQVAIKVLPPALANWVEHRTRFVREAQMAARLSHPNIVPIHRVDDSRGFVYFVMAYVNGETLAQRIARRGPLPPHQAARVLREVAWALTYAHANGIVHRDIKADNILLESASDRVLVTDFGIAGAAHSSATTSDGRVTGSAHYASPEQIAGQPVEAASDLYSLGVVGFFALTGRLPFDAPSVSEVVAMHLGTRAPSVTSLAPTVPAKLAHLVEWCLAKRAEDRPASAAAFAEAIDAAVEPPREIPPPLRIWLADSDRVVPLQVGVTILGTSVGVLAALTAPSPLVSVSCAVAVAGLGIFPSILNMKRVLAEGYTIDDLRSALREYWQRRREEAVYQTASPSDAATRRVTRWAFAGSMFGVLALATMAPPAAYAGVAVPVLGFMLACLGVGTGTLTVSDWIRRKRAHKLGSVQMRFYDSAWGERLVRLSSIGLQRTHAATALPQLTEVALGRATDALYDALPREAKRQLKTLPAVVRRLETDASAMRAEIERLDGSIADLDGDDRASIPSAAMDTEHEQRIRDDRRRLRADLAHLRDRAGARLAAVVAALESVRLGLLRVQLGDGAIESITATLDAAAGLAGDLGARADANTEVRRMLGAPTLAPRTSFP